MQLNLKAFAVASGVLSGLALLLVTLVAVARGNGLVLSHLSAIFVGYQVSYLGCLIGLVYGFVSGLIAGGILAAIYNQFLPAKT
jgi:hypothetical protein